MKPEMIELLNDLAGVLEKHAGGLTYTTDDDGVYVTQGDDWKTKVCIGWPCNGNVSELHRIIQANTI